MVDLWLTPANNYVRACSVDPRYRTVAVGAPTLISGELDATVLVGSYWYSFVQRTGKSFSGMTQGAL